MARIKNRTAMRLTTFAKSNAVVATSKVYVFLPQVLATSIWSFVFKTWRTAQPEPSFSLGTRQKLFYFRHCIVLALILMAAAKKKAEEQKKKEQYYAKKEKKAPEVKKKK